MFHDLSISLDDFWDEQARGPGPRFGVFLGLLVCCILVASFLLIGSFLGMSRFPHLPDIPAADAEFYHAQRYPTAIYYFAVATDKERGISALGSSYETLQKYVNHLLHNSKPFKARALPHDSRFGLCNRSWWFLSSSKNVCGWPPHRW